MKYIGIIPSRYGSTRLPAKALRRLCGKEMFWHVYTRARRCPLFTDIYLATDDGRIADKAHEYDIPVVMTSKEHTSGTERVYEAIQILGVEEDSIITNIQGDEPLVHPEMFTQLLSPFEKDPTIHVSTLYTDLNKEYAQDPARVKIAIDKHGKALYFSRSIIPYNRMHCSSTYHIHIGLYAFRYHALQQFVKWKQCSLELQESLEQLRFLYNGLPIHVFHTTHNTHSVDEERDIICVEEILKQERNIYGY